MPASSAFSATTRCQNRERWVRPFGGNVSHEDGQSLAWLSKQQSMLPPSSESKWTGLDWSLEQLAQFAAPLAIDP